MIYQYKCGFCGTEAERVCKVDERDDLHYCKNCLTVMGRVPCFGGGLKTEHPSWLTNDVRTALQDPSERPIETRKQHDTYCAERGIEHL